MRTYCISRCLSIRHGIGRNSAGAHSHTIEILAYIEKSTGDFEPFSSIEQAMDVYLSRFENHFLNSLPEFNGEASMEKIGEVFFAGLSRVLEERALFLRRLEVGETPLRRYIIGRLDKPDQACQEATI